MDYYEQYYQYLKKRSQIGILYRKWWLYPRLCNYIIGSVLDVGCGVGDMLAYRENTVGVDVNPHTVSWCKEQGFIAELMSDDNLPLPDSSFDSVLMDNVLEHIENPLPLLLDIKRVLKNDGVLLIGVPGRKGFDSDPDHKVYYDINNLIHLLGGIGFSLKKEFYMPFQFKFLDKVLSQYCLYATFQSSDFEEK